MMRVLCTVAALMLATVAVAGSPGMEKMTPEQAMNKMMNCPVCSAWMEDPAVGANTRHAVFATKNGYVETMMSADEKLMPAFEKAEAECEKRAQGIPTMAKEQKDKLCPLCIGHMTFMGRSDVSIEQFKAPQGWVVVASSNSPEGLKLLQDYAKTSENFGMLLQQADMSKQNKEVMKSKM